MGDCKRALCFHLGSGFVTICVWSMCPQMIIPRRAAGGGGGGFVLARIRSLTLEEVGNECPLIDFCHALMCCAFCTPSRT